MIKMVFGALASMVIILGWCSWGLSLNFIVLLLVLIGLFLIAIFKSRKGGQE